MRISDDQMNPELRFEGMVIRNVLPAYTERSLRWSEAWIKALFPHLPHPGLHKEVIHIGDQHLRLCVYVPKALLEQKKEPTGAAKTFPGMLWIHGGGYAMGAPEVDEPPYISHFVNDLGCVVVSPNYRLSLDAPYPAAIEDCYTALAWLALNATALGVDPDRLIVGGESAGGGLAAAVSILARDLAWPSITCQLPIYPMLDDRMLTPSSQDNDGPMWNSASNRVAWKLYLGDDYGTNKVTVYAAPGRLVDYSGLPPFISFVGSIDPFRDETQAYAEALSHAGIPAHLMICDGCFHGFDIVAPFTQVAKDAHRFMDHHLKPYLC